MVNYIQKNLINHIYEYDVILVGTGIYNALGNGFQRDMRLVHPAIDKANKATLYGNKRKLGTVTVVNESNLLICLCFINKGRFRPDLNPEYVDYDAVKKCLELIKYNFQGKKIGTTLLGHDFFEGDGNEQQLKKIIEEVFTDVDIDVYMFKQEDYEAREHREWEYVKSLIGTNEYRDEKKKYLWRRVFGVYKPIPNVSENEIKKIIKKHKEELKNGN
jgi:hypothetical protein